MCKISHFHQKILNKKVDFRFFYLNVHLDMGLVLTNCTNEELLKFD